MVFLSFNERLFSTFTQKCLTSATVLLPKVLGLDFRTIRGIGAGLLGNWILIRKEGGKVIISPHPQILGSLSFEV